jgi:hypothetical protein
MKRALSNVRQESPFATPPRVLVVADDESTGEALSLVEALESLGADAEVRFGAVRSGEHSDAVIVAEQHGYRVSRSHPILNQLHRVRH